MDRNRTYKESLKILTTIVIKVYYVLFITSIKNTTKSAITFGIQLSVRNLFHEWMVLPIRAKVYAMRRMYTVPVAPLISASS